MALRINDQAPDFTPVCATELGYVAQLSGEFAKRSCKVIGLSVDRVEDHLKWASDIEDLSAAKLYDMLPAEVGDSSVGRTAADNQTVRVVFLIAPDKSVKMSLAYPMSTARNFDELLRVLDSVQLTAKYRVATPGNWKQGEDVIILPAVDNDAAKELFPQGWETVKPYLRKVKDPSI